MASISLYEAKSRLSELVEQVESGREVIITKRGRPVAKIVRVKHQKEDVPADRAQVLAEIKAFARTLRLKKLTARELRTAREWGRK